MAIRVVWGPIGLARGVLRSGCDPGWRWSMAGPGAQAVAVHEWPGGFTWQGLLSPPLL